MVFLYRGKKINILRASSIWYRRGAININNFRIEIPAETDLTNLFKFDPSYIENILKHTKNLNFDLIEIISKYRYICTDCRAYIENPDDIYSKPLKCGYNPHTCQWEDWSSYPLKEMAIKHYQLTPINKE